MSSISSSDEPPLKKMKFSSENTPQTNTIQENDLVIVHLSDTDLRPITISSTSKPFQCKFGVFPHSQFIGKPFGSRLYSNQKGYITLLKPNPQLWTKALKHRTQILYDVDISMILMNLCLRVGSRVVESGTGSGSLSNSIARVVAPTGRLYTFEFHEQRYKEAKEEFEKTGISKVVTVVHRDVCAEGFSKVGDEVLDGTIDAVFLDLPKPWLTIDSVNKVLKERTGRFCSFSPCIEQVQKTCDKLREANFRDLVTIECLGRYYRFRSMGMDVPDFDKKEEKKEEKTKEKGKRVPSNSKDFIVSMDEMRGHTGYLTFARKP